MGAGHSFGGHHPGWRSLSVQDGFAGRLPIKNVEQQSVLSLHRVRQSFVRARTAQANQIRGLLGEYGLVVPQGLAYIAQRVPPLIEDAENELPGTFRLLIQRLEKVPGIGPLTASALVASIGDAKNFDNGRQFAAWLGVVPRQHSSGGNPRIQRLAALAEQGREFVDLVTRTAGQTSQPQ